MQRGTTSITYRPGQIVTAIFYNSSETSNRVASIANAVWNDLPYELDKYTGPPMNFNASDPDNAYIVSKLQINLDKLPVIVFLEKKEGSDWQIKNRLRGNVSREAIEATYFRIINNIYGRGDNALARLESEYGLIKSDSPGLLNNPEITRTLMSVLFAFASVKVATADSKPAKIIWGGLAAYSGYQLTRGGKSTVDFE